MEKSNLINFNNEVTSPTQKLRKKITYHLDYVSFRVKEQKYNLNLIFNTLEVKYVL